MYLQFAWDVAVSLASPSHVLPFDHVLMRMICEIKLRRDCSNREREREVHCSISPSVVNLSEYDDDAREKESDRES